MRTNTHIQYTLIYTSDIFTELANHVLVDAKQRLPHKKSQRYFKSKYLPKVLE